MFLILYILKSIFSQEKKELFKLKLHYWEYYSISVSFLPKYINFCVQAIKVYIYMRIYKT